MTEVFEQGVAISGRSKRESGAADAAEVGLHEQLIDRARRRAARATWSTSLGAKDLACLMAVIEGELLPSLLRSYRPPERTRFDGPALS